MFIEFNEHELAELRPGGPEGLEARVSSVYFLQPLIRQRKASDCIKIASDVFFGFFDEGANLRSRKLPAVSPTWIALCL